MLVKKDKIKLLFLFPTFTFGGAERTSLNLLSGIDKTRFRICLVTSENVFQYFRHIDIEKFIPIEALGIDVWFAGLRWFMRDVSKVASLLRTEKPDLAFGMMHYPSSLLVFANKIYNLKLKVIASPRGPSIDYLQFFEQKIFRKIYLKLIFIFFCKYADGIVVASRGMKDECARHFYAYSSKIAVVPNSVDALDVKIKAEENIDMVFPAGFRLICTSGRLETAKNLPMLLKAFSVVRMREKVKLLIIGDGVERQNLEKLSHELNIAEDVIFMGHQTNPYKFIKRTDMLVHPSMSEGFANAIIEAMACGVPVVALDCNYGPRDIIKHGENGFLVPMNDEGALIDAITTLLQDRRLRDDMARRSLERAGDFSVNSMVTGYENFLISCRNGFS